MALKREVTLISVFILSFHHGPQSQWPQTTVPLCFPGQSLLRFWLCPPRTGNAGRCRGKGTSRSCRGSSALPPSPAHAPGPGCPVPGSAPGAARGGSSPAELPHPEQEKGNPGFSCLGTCSMPGGAAAPGGAIEDRGGTGVPAPAASTELSGASLCQRCSPSSTNCLRHLASPNPGDLGRAEAKYSPGAATAAGLGRGLGGRLERGALGRGRPPVHTWLPEP